MSDNNFNSFMNNDDNDDDLIDDPKSNFWVLFSIAIAVVAISFAGWYVYDFYKEKNDNEMILITADHEEIKVEPAEPGGMVVDNMDKSVYESLEKPNNHQEAERVLLPSEEPVDRASIASAPAASDEVSTQDKKQEFAAEVELQANASPALLPAIENVPILEAKAEPKLDSKKAAQRPAKKAYKVQIASFKTKQDAEKEWSKLSRKYSNLLQGYNNYIATKDIVGKGTFYRLQIGPFDNSNSARSACNKLQKNGINCFVVKP